MLKEAEVEAGEAESIEEWYDKERRRLENPAEEQRPPSPADKIESETGVVEETESIKTEETVIKERQKTAPPTNEEIEGMIEEYIRTNNVGSLGKISEGLESKLTSFKSPEDKIWRILKRMEKDGKIEHRDVAGFSAPFVRYYALVNRCWGGNVGIEHVVMSKELLSLLETMNLPVMTKPSSMSGFPSFFDVVLEPWGIIEIETGLKHLMKSRKDVKQMIDDKVKKMESEGLSYMVFLAAKKDIANKIREAAKGKENIKVCTMRNFPKEFLAFFNNTFD